MFNTYMAVVGCLLVACLFSLVEHADGFKLYNNTGTETRVNFSSNNFSHNELISQNMKEISERAMYLEYVNKLLWLIFAPTLLLIGLVGNTLSVLVLKR